MTAQKVKRCFENLKKLFSRHLAIICENSIKTDGLCRKACLY
uniref:Uncharacterized protein n=1 Tax=Mycetohabitans sp. TaxID=2571162 RepID=A0A6B9HD10_9BURK|nr:hypothetical protein [Mycetohabitans sp.]